ncbi:MAG: response regulator [Anaerolineae bacterium]|nr:response regulator [Anaerolineae bacterium]
MNELDAVEILLVEDNQRDAELTIRALKKNSLANRLIHVQDGAEALDFLFGRGKYAEREINQRPRLVLLDLKLPKVSGLEVLRTIKQHEQTKNIPVVVVTSSIEDPDIQSAYALGVNSYVVKPVQFEAFSEAISRLGIYWLLVNHN